MSLSSQWLCGRAEVIVTGIHPVGFLNGCAAHNIPFEQPESVDECTMRLFLPNRLTAEAAGIANRCGCTMEVLRRTGGQRVMSRLRRRMGLFMGGVGLLVVLFLSSLFIWDIQVVDNDSAVSNTKILQILSESGVEIGTFWPGLSSDMVRSSVLQELPELCWLAVNVHGSRAEVVVRSAVKVPPVLEEGENIRIVADRAGIIESIHVQEGEAKVRVGDAVTAGDELVSGVRTGGFRGERTVRSQADITARTWYELVMQTPLDQQLKTPNGRKNLRLAMILGKRRINFYFDCGILGAKCDKITRIRTLGWKNVFSLPVSLVTETHIPWTAVRAPIEEEELAQVMERQLTEQLARQLGEQGEIVASRFDRAVVDGMLVVTLRSECLQPIGQEERFSVSANTNEPAEDTVWTEPLQWIGSRTF